MNETTKIDKVLLFPHPMLATPSEPVGFVTCGIDGEATVAANKAQTEHLKDLVSRMIGVIKKYGGAGLSAVQIGVLERVVVLRKADGTFESYVNPEIHKKNGEAETREEGCLSVPFYSDNATRHNDVEVLCLNEDGTKLLRQLQGWEARCIQHELEHLSGDIFIPKADRKKIREMSKTFVRQNYKTVSKLYVLP